MHFLWIIFTALSFFQYYYFLPFDSFDKNASFNETLWEEYFQKLCMKVKEKQYVFLLYSISLKRPGEIFFLGAHVMENIFGQIVLVE